MNSLLIRMNGLLTCSMLAFTSDLAGDVPNIGASADLSLTATLTNILHFGEPMEMQITVENKGPEIVRVSMMSPYSDCRIEVYDSDGEPAWISEFGRNRLAQNVFAKFRRPTQIEIERRPIIAWGGPRRSTGWLGVRAAYEAGPVAVYPSPDPREYSTTVDGRDRHRLGLPAFHPEDDVRRRNPPAYTWTIDLAKCYELQPGRHTVHVYYDYLKLKADPVEFEIKRRTPPEPSPGPQETP